MNEQEVREKCEAFVKSLGMPCFIVFGWEKQDVSNDDKKQYGMVSSYNKMPTPAVVKGMTWALNDIVTKGL
ncbi:hypothetical protein HN512_01675 [Candidatus Peregrinibacteria bacterium]|jgi:hypothetical protein|nr:hypothetical protein [Candidatus Peregrinibacteria bacterium]MBT3598523.1 hypothetical protein [Candidatus Peregrinibacteria bacterium]MBT4366800.1 hypothetical protein [Candidatus Peregrinibacteria bacterium]MBT4586081.1 hypothetical protein [Candidatus Peregrinibacteria bacterium]MBT6730345.1 hypothetical protein [Candidatus Peregrinibacteria bacterium]